MASKWDGQSCPLCGTGVLHDGIRPITQEYKGRTFRSETRGAWCDHCTDGMAEYDEQEEAEWLAFRDRVDAETASDLARIRKKLKLTQLEAARLTGGGKNAFSRYEKGQAKPMAAITNLFHLLDSHPELLAELIGR